MESPGALQDLCVAYVARNLDRLCEQASDEPGGAPQYRFRAPNVFLPTCVSEQLLAALDAEGLRDEQLAIFDPRATRLQRVRIQDAANVTTRGLRALRQHRISELVVRGLSTVTVNDLVGCLGDWTLQNLQVLDVSGGTFVSSERVRVVIALSKMKSLRHLDVSHSEFNKQALEIVTEDLPLLESLNISGTTVHSLYGLWRCQDKLKYLSLYNFNQRRRTLPPAYCFEPIEALENLVHLDLSDDFNDKLPAADVEDGLYDLLKNPNCLPKLVSLDVSGRCVDIETIKIFLQNHPQMQFIGLFDTKACENSMFCKPEDPLFSEKLVVAGNATEEQTLESLRRYMNRKPFLKKCLCSLYNYITNLVEERLDVIKLVLQSMKTSLHNLSIQMAATACLYNLTKGHLSFRIHTSWLKQIVDLTLICMEHFPKQRQLQRNSLLTLCTDRMLQDVSFDRYRCAELVMNSLMTFDDPAMNRMSVAICSILAARISTAETSSLGTRGDYMERLLSIVKAKCLHREIDIMMKFTLSALWNLTDESPLTCKVFLNYGGMDIYLKVLNKFPGESSVETKVLGLLNNIAEVTCLREQLKRDDFISVLKTLLCSEHVDVSYFAAGIMAHIASDGEELWTCTGCTWNDIVSELGSAVSSWEGPEMEMVAYRSFKPFYQLFSCSKAYQVQLWAAWAIYHVCSKNPKRYCYMLVEEEGIHILESLVQSADTHPSVANISKDILNLINEHLHSLCSHD